MLSDETRAVGLRTPRPTDRQVMRGARHRTGVGSAMLIMRVAFVHVSFASQSSAKHDGWASTHDIMTEVEGFRAERQRFLVESGTPKNGRYSGAKLNGRAPEVAVTTCDRQLERLEEKLVGTPADRIPFCFPPNARHLVAACGMLAESVEVGATELILVVQTKEGNSKAGVLLPCDGFDKAEGIVLALRDDRSVDAEATDFVTVTDIQLEGDRLKVRISDALQHRYSPLPDCVCEAFPAASQKAVRCDVLAGLWAWKAPPKPPKPPPAAAAPAPALAAPAPAPAPAPAAPVPKLFGQQSNAVALVAECATNLKDDDTVTRWVSASDGSVLGSTTIRKGSIKAENTAAWLGRVVTYHLPECPNPNSGDGATRMVVHAGPNAADKWRLGLMASSGEQVTVNVVIARFGKGVECLQQFPPASVTPQRCDGGKSITQDRALLILADGAQASCLAAGHAQLCCDGGDDSCEDVRVADDGVTAADVSAMCAGLDLLQVYGEDATEKELHATGYKRCPGHDFTYGGTPLATRQSLNAKTTTVSMLKAELERREIAVAASLRKPQLIAKLEEAFSQDEANGIPPPQAARTFTYDPVCCVIFDDESDGSGGSTAYVSSYAVALATDEPGPPHPNRHLIREDGSPLPATAPFSVRLEDAVAASRDVHGCRLKQRQRDSRLQAQVAKLRVGCDELEFEESAWGQAGETAPVPVTVAGAATTDPTPPATVGLNSNLPQLALHSMRETYLEQFSLTYSNGARSLAELFRHEWRELLKLLNGLGYMPSLQAFEQFLGRWDALLDGCDGDGLELLANAANHYLDYPILDMHWVRDALHSDFNSYKATAEAFGMLAWGESTNAHIRWSETLNAHTILVGAKMTKGKQMGPVLHKFMRFRGAQKKTHHKKGYPAVRAQRLLSLGAEEAHSFLEHAAWLAGEGVYMMSWRASVHWYGPPYNADKHDKAIKLLRRMQARHDMLTERMFSGDQKLGKRVLNRMYTPSLHDRRHLVLGHFALKLQSMDCAPSEAKNSRLRLEKSTLFDKSCGLKLLQNINAWTGNDAALRILGAASSDSLGCENFPSSDGSTDLLARYAFGKTLPTRMVACSRSYKRCRPSTQRHRLRTARPMQ